MYATWKREFPFLALSCFLHGWLIWSAPAASWLSRPPLAQPVLDPLVQIGFESLPPPAPVPAMAVAGTKGKPGPRIIKKPVVKKPVTRQLAPVKPKPVVPKKVVVTAPPKPQPRAIPVQMYTAEEKVDLEQQLAALPNPDSMVAAGPSAEESIKGVEKLKLPSMPTQARILDAMGQEEVGPATDAESAGEEGSMGTGKRGNARGGGDEGSGPVSWLLDGPAGNRKILKQLIPQCPDWVSSRNLDLAVKLKFRVLENGSVKEAILIKQTSGFPFIDRLALEALRQWRFQGAAKESLRDSKKKKSTEVWGIVTFRFVAV
ncbi:MAG: TonB family protein [Elusimicrobia bacterium]|nr:TonB family protein [Elusimicrobiota bacterium]